MQRMGDVLVVAGVIAVAGAQSDDFLDNVGKLITQAITLPSSLLAVVDKRKSAPPGNEERDGDGDGDGDGVQSAPSGSREGTAIREEHPDDPPLAERKATTRR